MKKLWNKTKRVISFSLQKIRSISKFIKETRVMKKINELSVHILNKLKVKFQIFLKFTSNKIIESKIWNAFLTKFNLETTTVAGKIKTLAVLGVFGFSFISISLILEMIFSNIPNFVWILDIITLLSICIGVKKQYKHISDIKIPLDKLINVSQNIAKGDLTQRTGIIRQDEIGMVSKAFDEMIQSIEEIINNVQYSSERTIKGTKNLNSISIKMKASSGEIQNIIQEVSNGSNIQSQINTEITEKISKLMDFSNIVSDKNEEIELKANSTKESIFTSQTEFTNLMNNVENITNSSNSTYQKIKEFEKDIERIFLITEQTNQITSKTKILAFNTSIEAARVGEAGKGFEVVAQEMKKLADQTKESSKEIKEIANTISKSIIELSKQMELNVQYVNSGNDSAEKAKHSLHFVIQEMDEVVASVKEMKELMFQQKEFVSVVENQTAESSAISSQIFSNSEQVNTITQDFVAKMEKVSEMTKKLEKISNDLKQSTEKFQVENVGFYL